MNIKRKPIIAKKINTTDKISTTGSIPAEFYDEVEKLRKKYRIREKITISTEKNKKEYIPISIFKNRKLSSLEAIAKYCRENRRFSFRKTGNLLNRSQFTMASSYHVACKKFRGKLSARISEFDIPASAISNRKLSVLENIVAHLKRNHGLKLSEIARMLSLDQRTIWTVYARANKKLKNK